MSKPKEFWITLHGEELGAALDYENKDIPNPKIHVIEKAAYDEAIKKLKIAYQWLHPSRGTDIGIGKILKNLGELDE